MELNTQPQRLQALLDGHTLISRVGVKFKIVDDVIKWTDSDVKDWYPATANFSSDTYILYTEPKWYETAVSGKTLIFVKDCKDGEWGNEPRVFEKHLSDRPLKFLITTGTLWKYAKPLTKAEVMEFLENAAEVGE